MDLLIISLIFVENKKQKKMDNATQFRMDLVCSKDDLKPAMNYVNVQREWTEATDAHIALRVKTSYLFNEEFVEQIPESGFLIHREDWARIAKADFLSWKNEDTIRLIHSKKRDVLIEIEYHNDVGRYPILDSVFPDQKDKVELSNVGINADLLQKLQKATKANSLELEFYGQSKAIVVSILNAYDDDMIENVKGLIMPIRITE